MAEAGQATRQVQQRCTSWKQCGRRSALQVPAPQVSTRTEVRGEFYARWAFEPPPASLPVPVPEERQ